MSSTKFVFLGADQKPRSQPRPLIGWDFSSETADPNSAKRERKQDLNIYYQVCVSFDQWENKDGNPGLWLA